MFAGVCGSLGRISRSGLTQDIKMGTCVLEQEPCKGIMRKACHVSDILWEKIEKCEGGENPKWPQNAKLVTYMMIMFCNR